VIRADEHGLVVRNLLLTRRLRWDEVRGFRADGSLVVALAHGPDLRCWAVQSANIAWLLDRRSSPGSDSDPTARSAICPARSTRPFDSVEILTRPSRRRDYAPVLGLRA
jgi:hypothetical protein